MGLSTELKTTITRLALSELKIWYVQLDSGVGIDELKQEIKAEYQKRSGKKLVMVDSSHLHAHLIKCMKVLGYE